MEDKVPQYTKSAPMTISKILQFMYNQAEVKDEKLLPFKDFISEHTKAPIDLTISILV